MPTEAKHTATQTVFNVLAVAASAFLLFGARRNHGSQGALMSGLGELFKGVAQGRQQKVKEDSVKWHQLNESIQAENKGRLQTYKDVLANRKLNLGQQMDLIKMHAQFHKDQRLEEAADQRNLAAVQKNLENKQRQLKDHATRTTKGTVPKNSVMLEDYRQRVFEKSGGKVDFNTDPDKAREVYPWSEFLKDSHRDEARVAKKAQKDGAADTTATPAPTKPQDKSADLDQHIAAMFNGTGNQPKMDTKTNESVLAQPDSVLTNTGGQGNESGL
jgi:hypothetical protein